VLANLARLLVVMTAVILVAGCVSTRIGTVGPLPGREPLVTLVVTEDRQVVQRECRHVLAPGLVLGCRISRTVALPDGRDARAVTIVRYTDSLPSRLAFEIEAHELCHAIASLQAIDDPCHAGNNGVLTAESATRIR
jgi:hypothetical protein